ncbi:MAG: 16S rRNA (cytosine(967)-C(5))-methyltransferase RsmB [Oscillospiraceae bacterium]|jgi:16S rRNA (cytosine967-C5)-methyltransferase|nr:16S rRNA (cytosine(967)-C(5))-methyltransferase RsmB [Oscillospiraceae bacterium]
MGGHATPRLVAFRLLRRMEQNGAYANLALDSALGRENLSEADSALCAALVYGVAERRRTLEYQLEDLLRKPLRQLPPEAKIALELGLYQLYFMQRIPAHAAINESVELVKHGKAAFAAGMVNAVLRRAAGRELRLPVRGEDELRWLSIRYSCPEWLCRLWVESYGGETAEALLAAALEQAPLALRVNTRRCTPAQLRARLEGAGVACAASPWLPAALLLPKSGAIPQLPGFGEGWFHVQDTAAQLCCRALAPEPGETVFDLCAAPGGKSFTLAQMMEDQGRVVAMELHPARVALIAEGAQRLGLRSVAAEQGDAADAAKILANHGKAARILCDVPCSGLGVLRKKPDIREKTQTDIDKLPKMQYHILCSASECLREDGTLVYATCTLHPAENEELCRRFLQEHPAFTAESVLPEVPGYRREGEPWLTLMPHINGADGFFIAKFTKRNTHASIA